MPGRSTRRGALVVDHVDNVGRSNAPSNLVPSCHRCNAIRQRRDLVSDGEPFVLMGDKPWRHRAERRTCICCGSEFLHLAADRRPNRGRFCSLSCARSKKRHAGS